MDGFGEPIILSLFILSLFDIRLFREDSQCKIGSVCINYHSISYKTLIMYPDNMRSASSSLIGNSTCAIDIHDDLRCPIMGIRFTSLREI